MSKGEAKIRASNRKAGAVPLRPPQKGIPATADDRAGLREQVSLYARSRQLVPPLSLEEIQQHIGLLTAQGKVCPDYVNYAAVLLSNEVWRDDLAAVPYDRRLLLLPQCLRDAAQCPGEIGELGLSCRNCGRCVIGELVSMARGLGYVTLVAEGATLVRALIESGQVEAVVGVGCMSVLEQIFPYIEAGAVPGIAIPLLYDGCEGTAVDVDWLSAAIEAAGSDKGRLDMEELRERVAGWFTAEALADVMGPVGDPATAEPPHQTEALARQWLTLSGKRWRPFLAACAFDTLRGPAVPGDVDDIRRIAVAVECFHKASLIHDDIEDGDSHRYGVSTLHEQYGVPVALNVGDLLLGEGYRLLAQCRLPADRRADMLAAAARGHRTLCLGQGAELCWARRPRPLSVEQMLEIFRQKTSPAFEVALQLGAIAAGADDRTRQVLSEFSDCLGIAYQIRDDLADPAFSEADQGGRRLARPSILFALAWQLGQGSARDCLEGAIAGQDCRTEAVAALLAEPKVRQQAESLLEHYHRKATQCLCSLRQAGLKISLRRVLTRILVAPEKMSCCDDNRHGNDSGGVGGR